MSNHSFLFADEPHWSVCRALNYRHIPEIARSWLFEAGSITQRLREQYGDALAVKVLRQSWEQPFLTEKRMLRSTSRRRCLIREVLLHRDGVPLVLARTVIPAKTLRGVHRNLARLGSRPLGEVIFADPHLQRLEMHLTTVVPQLWKAPLLERVPISAPVWGRRTVYAIRRRQLLVSEFFLPELVSR